MTGSFLRTSSGAIIRAPGSSGGLQFNKLSDIAAVTEPTLRYALTTGSMTAGSNRVDVASVTGFNLYDHVVVEIGGEAGQGLQGSVGVGGVWPPKSYANVSLLLADEANATRTFAYARDTLDVYQWSPDWATGEWYRLADANSPTIIDYYYQYPTPYSLISWIIDIDSTGFWLYHSAVVSTSNARVMLDMSPTLNAVFEGGARKIELPSGEYFCADYMKCSDKRNIEIYGQGATGIGATKLLSPKGVPGACIQLVNSHNCIVHDIYSKGNALHEGYGFIRNNPHQIERTTKPEMSSSFDSYYGSNNTFYNIVAEDPFSHGITALYSDKIHIHDSAVIRDVGFRAYTQWMIQIVHSSNGIVEDCDISCNEMVCGFNAWACNRPTFRRLTGTNAMCAMNGSGAYVCEDIDLVWEQNAQSDTHIAVPIGMECSKNQDNSASMFTDGGVIRRFTLDVQGFLPAEGNVLLQGAIKAVVINPPNSNVTVEDSDVRSVGNKLIGYLSAANAGSQFSNCHVYGPDAGTYHTEYGANIYNQFGTVTNCYARDAFGSNTGGSIHARYDGGGNDAQYKTFGVS